MIKKQSGLYFYNNQEVRVYMANIKRLSYGHVIMAQKKQISVENNLTTKWYKLNKYGKFENSDGDIIFRCKQEYEDYLEEKDKEYNDTI